MGPAVVFGGWSAPLAWLIVSVCIALAVRARVRLAALAPPPVSKLLEELRGELEPGVSTSSAVRLAAIAELNQRIADVSFAIDLLPATYAALTRISLASGTALALIAFLQTEARSPIERATQGAVCALSGFVGAGAVAALGRAAKRRVEEIRATWDSSSREIGKSLGPPLS